MMDPLAVDHCAQLKAPRRQFEPGLEATDIGRERGPASSSSEHGFNPGPLSEGDLDRTEAAQAGKRFEQLLLEKGRVRARFQAQGALQAGANLADQFAHEALGALGLVDVAGVILETKDAPGPGQVSEPRIVTAVLGMTEVEAAHDPSDLVVSTNHGAFEVDGQAAKRELFDLFIEQFAVELHQREQRTVSKLFEPVDYRAIVLNARQSATPSEQLIVGGVAKMPEPARAQPQQCDRLQYQAPSLVIAADVLIHSAVNPPAQPYELTIATGQF